jgi:small subunit ribosomal protein S8
VYVGSDRIPRVIGGMGTAVISTSTGIITGHDARRQGVGGEVLCTVW